MKMATLPKYRKTLTLPSTSNSSSQQHGLTRYIINNYRFQVAVTVKGKHVLLEVFDWLYQGKGSYIKSFIVANHSMKKFKSLFNKDQMNLLDPETNWKNFDISLLYVLLQNVCGLAPSNDPIWNTTGSQSLEHRLYQVKSFRNNVAHMTEIQPLSDLELAAKLNDLQNVLSDVLRLAGNHAGKDPGLIGGLIVDIALYFQELQTKLREPLDVNDVSLIPHLQLELAIFMDDLKSGIQLDCENELTVSYPNEFELELVHWLMPDVNVRPSLMFTKIVIAEDVSLSRPSQNMQPRDLMYEEVLCEKRQDGHVPNVLIITGEGGVGKSTFLKYLVEKWVDEVKFKATHNQGQQVTEIKGLHHFSPLLFFQLRETTVSTWVDMLDRRLTKSLTDSGLSIRDFGQLVKQMNTIILLDGFDEARAKSVDLVRELFDIPNIRIIVTTRPDCLPKLTKLVPGRKKMMTVKVLGIGEEDRDLYIEKTLTALVPDVDRRAEAKEKLCSKLSEAAFETEFSSPLFLEMLIMLEIESPDVITADSASREVYQELLQLIRGKVEDRRTLLGISDLQYKMSLYIKHQEKISLQAILNNEHDLSTSTVSEIEAKCREVGLPSSEILSGFFTLKRTWQGLRLANTWSYPHGRFQEQWAANYVVNQLQNFELKELPVVANEFSDEEPEIPKSPKVFEWSVQDISDPQSIEDVPCREPLIPAPSPPPALAPAVPMNPILEIMSNGEGISKKLLRSEKVQNVLAVTLGLLAQSHQQLLKKVAPAILALTRLTKMRKSVCMIDKILALVQESKKDEDIILPVVDRLKKFRGWTSYGKYVGVLPDILNHFIPEMVEVTLHPIPLTSSTEYALKVLSETNTELRIKAKKESCFDHYMEIFTNPNSRCSLCEIWCCVSEQGMARLPVSLCKLIITTDMKGICALALKLASLVHLTYLAIDVRDVSRPTPASLQSLPFAGYLLLLTSPLCLSTADIVWWCDVLARLNLKSSWTSLTISISTAKDTLMLLKELNIRKIHSEWLYINTEDDLNPMEKQEAEKEAKALSTCTNFFVGKHKS